MKIKNLLIIFGLLALVAFSRDNTNTQEVISFDNEKKGLFFSYIDFIKYIKDEDISKMKKNIDKVIKDVKNIKFNLIVLQVRSNSDAIYESKIFPWSTAISPTEGEKSLDALAYFLKKAHKQGISIYAWINPYRVRTTEDINSISSNNPAYKYIGTDTLYVNNGIYYNPSKKEVSTLIVDGVKEIVDNYKVDGVIFDDYFYPSNDIDLLDYENYLKTHSYIDKASYNLMIVNNLLKKVHTVCQEKKVSFGVSPEGNIENNYTKNYADVKQWLSSKDYVDFIMPQIYYGFFNETQGFQQVLQKWTSLIKNENIKLLVALAFYKVGTFDFYAKSGSNEWLTNDNIIMREIMLSRNNKFYEGFCLFRYGFLFDKDLYSDKSLAEIKNMEKILQVE